MSAESCGTAVAVGKRRRLGEAIHAIGIAQASRDRRAG